MSMILYRNKTEVPTLTASSEISSLPVENILSENLGKVWRTDATARTETVVFDYGTAVNSSNFFAFFDNITVGNDTVFKLQANTSDSWVSPPFDETLDIDYNRNYVVSFSSDWGSLSSYRYWRFLWTKGALNRDCKRIIHSVGSVVAADIDYTGWSINLNDLSETTRTQGGQTYSDNRGFYNGFTVNMREVDDNNLEVIKNFVESVGTTEPFVFVAKQNDSSLTADLREYFLVKFKKLPRYTVAGYDGGYLWDVDLEFAEEK